MKRENGWPKTASKVEAMAEAETLLASRNLIAVHGSKGRKEQSNVCNWVLLCVGKGHWLYGGSSYRHSTTAVSSDCAATQESWISLTNMLLCFPAIGRLSKHKLLTLPWMAAGCMDIRILFFLAHAAWNKKVVVMPVKSLLHQTVVKCLFLQCVWALHESFLLFVIQRSLFMMLFDRNLTLHILLTSFVIVL
jgi:hypothetical protein